MLKGTTSVGMDVRKRSIALALRDPSGTASEQTIPYEPRAILRWVQQVKREAPGPVRCADEAGPCGYGPQRQLRGEGLRVGVRCDRTLSEPT